jgi:hypothetical protein
MKLLQKSWQDYTGYSPFSPELDFELQITYQILGGDAPPPRFFSSDRNI